MAPRTATLRPVADASNTHALGSTRLAYTEKTTFGPYLAATGRACRTGWLYAARHWHWLCPTVGRTTRMRRTCAAHLCVWRRPAVLPAGEGQRHALVEVCAALRLLHSLLRRLAEAADQDAPSPLGARHYRRAVRHRSPQPRDAHMHACAIHPNAGAHAHSAPAAADADRRAHSPAGADGAARRAEEIVEVAVLLARATRPRPRSHTGIGPLELGARACPSGTCNPA